jgi:hypothetical protein
MNMADPDAPPEVDPTRKDPDEPQPYVPVRLPMVSIRPSCTIIVFLFSLCKVVFRVHLHGVGFEVHSLYPKSSV